MRRRRHPRALQRRPDGGQPGRGPARRARRLRRYPPLLIAQSRPTNAAVDGSICDPLLARSPAELPFAVHRHRVGPGPVATDDAVLSAMRAAFEEFRIVLESGGAAALADPESLRGRTTLVIASGGNVDADVFARTFRQADDRRAA